MRTVIINFGAETHKSSGFACLSFGLRSFPVTRGTGMTGRSMPEPTVSIPARSFPAAGSSIIVLSEGLAELQETATMEPTSLGEL